MMNASKLRLMAIPSPGPGIGVVAEVISPEACSADEARVELRRVLGSAHFEASERNRRFLEYVVEETLAGRAERIKAYSIATIVFGRDTNFDAQLDPVVRMEARRLRRSLERLLPDGGQEQLGQDRDAQGRICAGIPARSRGSMRSDFAPSARARQGFTSSRLVDPGHAIRR